MTEYRILVPVIRNTNRKRHSGSVWFEWEQWLLENFNGYTVGHDARGEWIGPHGLVVDRSATYYVADSREFAARQLADKVKELFDQTCVYISQCEAYII